MIRYAISKDQLEHDIEAEKPGWLAKAKERTDKFAELGRYEEKSSIWSEIKVVYMRLQHCKCAYCERQLESEEYGLIEHDMEHFRPKKKAKPWKMTKVLQKAGVLITPPVSGKADPGYHLLAYNPLNYCTSCKTCNSNLKNDHFPIAGVRCSGGDDPVRLGSEKPLLINPVGDYDDDPTSLIAFHGVFPIACGDTDYKRHRGLVSIAFFHLDDRKRKYLMRERAEIIVSLYSYFRNSEAATNQADKKVYDELVEEVTKPSHPHANCARSFRELYFRDRNEAAGIFNLSRAYLKSMSD